MGRKCSAPGCRSNYDNNKEYVTVFKFPSEPSRRAKWIHNLHRVDFNPSSTAVVCIKHFEERFIIREDSVKRKDGTILTVDRKQLALSSEAYPTIFENLPPYLTKKVQPERKDHEKRREEVRDRDEMQFIQWCSKDTIKTFKQFTDNCDNYLNNSWLRVFRCEYVLFFKLQDSYCPKIIVSFKVHENLDVEIWHENILVDMTSFKWLLGSNNKCDRWTKFENILNLLSSYNEHNLTFKQKLTYAVQLLEKCTHDDECKNNENLLLKIGFVKQQISLMCTKRLKYTTDLILWCAKIYFSFPAAYLLIRDSQFLTLPHPSYLKKLTSLCTPTYSFSSYNSYLKNKSDLLKEEEKIVNVLLDEIYVNPSLTYKAGHVVGMSENSDLEASTIQAFMISSLLSKNKDVIALFPVRNLTADILINYANKVLSILHECGFTVLALISDNNRINRNMFTNMCGGELKSFISNPYCPLKKLFFLFDSVHLIKAIRNNWLNQTICEQTFYFPNPDNGQISHASLLCLKNIYDTEKSCVLKTAPKLSQKVLYPNSIEKQNVKYALNLFHGSNSSALEVNKEKAGDNALDTKMFIDFISNWWKIINVKHPKKGEHTNDKMSHPIKTLEDSQYIFLQKFSCWLNEWNKLSMLKRDEKRKLGIPCKGGFLSKETFFALKFTTDTMLEIVKHAFESLGMSYILLGKFQTDNLEARFGQYRQMSGGNYNISCLQVLESERKLKILSLIRLYSSQKGEFQLKNLDYLKQNENFQSFEVPEFFYNTFNSHNDFEIPNDTMSVLIYIAGYVAHKVCHKLTCEKCILFLVGDKTLELECSDEIFKYLMITDRGKLKWPQKLIIDISIISFQIFQKLISQTFENDFITYAEPKNLFIQLILDKIELIGIAVFSKCNCGNDLSHLLKLCLSGIANIYLNNYTKVKNDYRKTHSTKRKLSVLMSS